MKEKLVLWGVLLAAGLASLEEYNAFWTIYFWKIRKMNCF